MADERDPIAAMHNQGGKQDEKANASNANYTEAFDAPDGQGVIGPGDPPQHRAPAGEGHRAPSSTEGSSRPPQYSSFDGSGNERVVVLTENAMGQPIKATGPDAASALAAGQNSDDQLGDEGYGKPSGRPTP